MPYCSRCGVEVEGRAATCPLCDAAIQHLDHPADEPARYPVIPPSRGRQIRYLVWMISTVAILSLTLALVTLDAVLNPRLTWSLYPLIGLGILWLFITLVVIFARRPIFVIVGQAISTAGFLLMIDLSHGELDWFVPLGLPMVGVVTAASVGVWLVSRLSRRAPALVTGAVLLACGIGSVALDLLVSGHLGSTHVSWSYIVLSATLPPGLFLLYFHFRLSRRIDLRQILDA